MKIALCIKSKSYMTAFEKKMETALLKFKKNNFIFVLLACAISSNLCAYYDEIIEDKEDAELWHVKQDLLYWRVDEEGLSYTNKPSDIRVTDDFTETSLVDPDFEWDFGFRVVGAYTPRCSNWTYSLSWASIENKATGFREVDSDFEGIFPVWSMSPDTLVGDFASSADMHWHVRSNIFDLDAQYTFCWMKNLNLIPVIGIRFASLHQKLHVTYSGGTFFSGDDENFARNRFDGIGPRFGTGANYDLCHGFSLHGLAAVAPMYGRFSTTHREFYLDAERFDHSDHFNSLAVVFDYQIGIEWKTKLPDSKQEISLAAYWEGHIFYNQNRMFRGEHGFFKKDRNLTLEGLTLSASLCF